MSSMSIGAKSPSQCAGLNRHEAGNARVLRERSSEPLGPEFCVVRKDAIRTPTLLTRRKATLAEAASRVPARSCVVVDPRHIWKLHAREPGDLGDACCCLTGSRTAGEGSGRTTRMYVAEE